MYKLLSLLIPFFWSITMNLPQSTPQLLFPQDSVGQVVESGVIFILYKVDSGETIFRISQKYDVSAYDIKEANLLKNYDIEVGQLLKIPRKKVEPVGRIPKKHVVAPGDNLYNISKKYHISVKELLDMNQLTDYSLPEGKILIVGYDVLEDNSTENVSIRKENTSVKPRESEKVKGLPPTAFAYANYDLRKKVKYYEVSEIGEVVLSSQPTINHNRLQCFHDFLPVGSLIEITHLITGRSVFVEVIGKKVEKEPILEVSQRAFDYLGYQNQKSIKTTILYRWEVKE